jgi:hypothetical protein
MCVSPGHAATISLSASEHPYLFVHNEILY